MDPASRFAAKSPFALYVIPVIAQTSLFRDDKENRCQPGIRSSAGCSAGIRSSQSWLSGLIGFLGFCVAGPFIGWRRRRFA